MESGSEPARRRTPTIRWSVTVQVSSPAARVAENLRKSWSSSHGYVVTTAPAMPPERATIPRPGGQTPAIAVGVPGRNRCQDRTRGSALRDVLRLSIVTGGGGRRDPGSACGWLCCRRRS